MRAPAVLAATMIALSAQARLPPPSTASLSGLGFLPTTDVLPSMAGAAALSFGYFGAGNFIVPQSSASSIFGSLALTWAYGDFLEIGWDGRASRSSLSLPSAPTLAAGSVGDQRLSLKLVQPFLSGELTGGVVGALDIPAPPSGQSILDGLGGEIDLLGTWHESAEPWRLHGLVGYFHDRSGNYLPAISSPFQTYALGVSQYDRFRAALAFEWAFSNGSAFAEGLFEQPLAGPLPTTISDSSLRFTLGVQVDIAAGLGVLAAFDVAANPWQPVPEENAIIEAPYTATVGLTYAFDPNAFTTPVLTSGRSVSPGVSPPAPPEATRAGIAESAGPAASETGGIMPNNPPVLPPPASSASVLPPPSENAASQPEPAEAPETIGGTAPRVEEAAPPPPPLPPPARTPPPAPAVATPPFPPPPTPTNARESAALEQKALKLHDEGDWPQAIAYLKAAYHATLDPELLRTLGDTCVMARENREAITAYSKYLAAVPNSPHTTQVQKKLADLAIASVTKGPPANDTLPPVIEHTPLARVEAGQIITIEADIHDESGVALPLVQYRGSPNGPYLPAALVPEQGDHYVAHLPAMAAGTLEYYIEAYDSLGNGPTRHGTPSYPHVVPVEP